MIILGQINFSELDQREFASIRMAKKKAAKAVDAILSGKATGAHYANKTQLETDIAKQGYKTMNGISKKIPDGKFLPLPTYKGTAVNKLSNIYRKVSAATHNAPAPSLSKGAMDHLQFLDRDYVDVSYRRNKKYGKLLERQ